MAPMDGSFAGGVGALDGVAAERKRKRAHRYSASSSALRALARSFSLSDFS